MFQWRRTPWALILPAAIKLLISDKRDTKRKLTFDKVDDQTDFEPSSIKTFSLIWNQLNKKMGHERKS